MKNGILIIFILVIFCVTYTDQRAIVESSVANKDINGTKIDALAQPPPPLSIRRKREINLDDLGLGDLGLGEDILKGLIKKLTELLTDGASSLGLDKFGLDKEVIEGLIEKIIKLIMNGFGDGSDSGGGDESVTESAAALDEGSENAKVLSQRRKKREIDLGSLGLDGLGLGADQVKDLSGKITTLIENINGLGLNELGLGNDVIKNLLKKIIDKMEIGNSGGGATGAPPSAAPTTTLGCRPNYRLCFF